MAVYVDELMTIEARGAQAHRVGARHGHRWCHLFADSLDELHAVARRIGMKRAWFQNKRLPHYDLVPTRRAAAIRAGAIPLGRREAHVKRMELRARSVPGNQALATGQAKEEDRGT